MGLSLFAVASGECVRLSNNKAAEDRSRLEECAESAKI